METARKFKKEIRFKKIKIIKIKRVLIAKLRHKGIKINSKYF